MYQCHRIPHPMHPPPWESCAPSIPSCRRPKAALRSRARPMRSRVEILVPSTSRGQRLLLPPEYAWWWMTPDCSFLKLLNVDLRPYEYHGHIRPLRHHHWRRWRSCHLRGSSPATLLCLCMSRVLRDFRLRKMGKKSEVWLHNRNLINPTPIIYNQTPDYIIGVRLYNPVSDFI